MSHRNDYCPRFLGFGNTAMLLYTDYHEHSYVA